ncbi:thymic stromal cotransporter homolog [Anguilla anguilla]|uniref:thymic stromal cotransporter homolog n=1 Tax=Anguilla anguilla TaxID=7936 RepID=UPI0015ADEB2A|nr:thymic stromal cotransporter homolog [Anguilla anguilla]XP_035270830.1 thymic stromal cotransporter homolog [Anguilla anguilla]
MGGFLTLVEPVVVINTVGSSFYDTALTLSVYKRALEQAEGHSDQAQALASRFLLLNTCLACLLSFISTVLLGWLADRRGPRLLLVLPQIGSVVRKSFLLAFVLFQLPLAVLYVGAAVHGLCGGWTAYWGGVVSLAALSSGHEGRSLKLNAVDFCSGVAGVVGGLLSGYIYQLGESGLPLIMSSVLLCVGGLLYSAFLLSYPRPPSREEVSQSAPSQEPVWTDWRSVALLFTAIALFDVGMSGAEDVLSLYVLKPPLSWDSVWVGYGSAATSAMYLSSFLGVLVLSRPLGDTALILLGIVSNCTGMAIMAFATQNWVYFFARGIMMFACIPMPTIRAQLSKILDAQLYGRVFGWLQSILAVTTVLSEVLFTSIYPLTLGWFSGFSFLTSCAISYLSVLPILYLNWRGTRQGYTPIPGNDQA